MGSQGQELSGFAGREVHRFSSIAEAARTTDSVVLGTVEQTSPGRADGPPGQEIYFTNTYIRVDEEWLGSGVNQGDVIVVETLQEQAFAREWRSQGTQVLLALTKHEVSSQILYAPTNTQIVFLVEGTDLIAAQDDDFALFVASLPLGEVRERVQRAREGRG